MPPGNTGPIRSRSRRRLYFDDMLHVALYAMLALLILGVIVLELLGKAPSQFMQTLTLTCLGSVSGIAAARRLEAEEHRRELRALRAGKSADEKEP